MTAQQVLTALAAIRAPQTQDEYDLHGLVADALQRADIDFHHEAPLAPRCRIDFLCDTVGIEIKRGRPDVTAVTRQLKRYADSGKLTAIILLSEKTAPSLPGFVSGIPVYPVSLQKLWGIAIGVGEEETAVSSSSSESKANSAFDIQPPLPVIPSEAERERSEVEGPERPSSAEEPFSVGADIIRPSLEEPPDQESERADNIRPYKETSPCSFGLEDRILRDLSNEDVPPFLREGEPASYYYGTLSYNARRKCWTIKGDPAVTELAKRLFPGSDAKRGEARFTAHRRIIGDVNWLMLRYPLQVAERDRERWRQALNQARDYYREDPHPGPPALPGSIPRRAAPLPAAGT